jgi:hypothetical protein
MNTMQMQGLATQRHAMDLAAAAEGRDASGQLLRPAYGTRLGRLLVDAGTRLLSHPRD